MWPPTDGLKQISGRQLWTRARVIARVSLLRVNWAILLEFCALLAWAMVLCWPYLDLDQRVMPNGREFGMAIQPAFIWTLFPRCGACVLWNGFVNGGNPAFVELHGVVLHPLVIITTLIWGGVNGAKIALVASFALAGWAQWWLARVLGLGRVARLWSGALAISAGHLAGRMNVGVFGVVLSTAACSLLLPPMIDLALRGRRRTAIVLGALFALALVGGQGYLQIGVIIAVVPAVLLFVLASPKRRMYWKEFALAGILGLLLAGVFVVPVIHFWPNLAKDIDPAFSSVQPVEYLPLNLVIHDAFFYTQPGILSKLPYPYLYVSYISWVPIVLALVAIRLTPRRDLPLHACMGLAIVLLYLASSLGNAALRNRLGTTFLASVRNPPLIAGLAVPLILAIAAWGLDRLRVKSLPSITFYPSSEHAGKPLFTLPLGQGVIMLALLWALFSTYTFDRVWMGTTTESPEIGTVLERLRTPTTQWVEPPYGEHYWTPPALLRGLKITTITRPWYWKDRPVPLPYTRSFRNADDPLAPSSSTVEGVMIGALPQNQYALITGDDQPIPCEARAMGGNIDVTCTSHKPGRLIVQENMWTGWYARRDGTSVPLHEGTVLSVDAPAGTHHYAFRYRPWDVWLGLGLTFVGIALCVWLWRKESMGRVMDDV
jgi:hypothetical protein